ncbi:hypothetical protein [Fontivita pretiosa]|uniref:hypothetical protein n=1 Tax=Fontivita pretiosa TaxID=2989684 RepID=UPI003D181361
MRAYSMAGVVSIAVIVGAVVLAQDQGGDHVPRQRLATVEQASAFAEAFLRTLASGSAFEAFNAVKSALPGEEAVAVDQTRDATLEMLDRLRPTHGDPVGYDIVARRSLGSSVVRIECLLKLQRYPVRCTVVFYRPHDSWLPVQILFDEDIRLMFEELNR